MGFSISRVAFTHMNNTTGDSTVSTSSCLAYTLWNDMVANGFTLVDSDTYTSSGISLVPAITSKTTIVVLKPGVSVDPLVATQPWIVVMKLRDGSNWPSFKSLYGVNMTTAGIQIGTNSSGLPIVQSFPNTGFDIAIVPVSPTETLPKVGDAKVTGAQYLPIVPPLTCNANDPTPRIFPGRPYGYLLTIVPRGFVLNIYDTTSTENIQLQGTVCVQRAMTCSGKYASTGNTPLYLVTNVSPMYVNSTRTSTDGINALPGPQPIWFSEIIREENVMTTLPVWNYAAPTATQSFYADTTTPNSSMNTFTTSISTNSEIEGNVIHRFPMTWNAPVTGDTGEYILVFPFGICSNRFAYTDELDLIAVSKADAYQSGQNIPLTVYGDSRTYTAMSSNNAQYNNNGGIRVFILSESSEI